MRKETNKRRKWVDLRMYLCEREKKEKMTNKLIIHKTTTTNKQISYLFIENASLDVHQLPITNDIFLNILAPSSPKSRRT